MGTTANTFAPQTLWEEKDPLHIIFDAAPVGITLAALDGTFLKANSEFQRMVGYSEEELGHHSGLNLTYDDGDRARNKVMREELIAGTRQHYEIEKRYRTKTGNLIWVRLKCTLIRDAYDRPHATVAMVQDITEQKRAAEELRASEERFALFMAHTPGAFFVKDSAGRYVYANRVCEAAMGVGPGGWAGKTDDMVFPPETAREIMAHDREVMAKSEPLEVVETVLRGNEVEYWLSNKFLIPSGAAGALIGGAALNITQLRRTTEALQVSEAHLRKLLEERERLSRDLHDNIMQSIYAIGMGLETCQNAAYEDPKYVSAQLGQAIGGLNAVIRDVRRYISGYGETLLSGPQLRAELAKLVREIGERGIPRFRFHVDEQAILRLDSAQAENVLHIAREALSNALRHSGAKRGMLSLHIAGNTVRLEVSDTGRGFDPSVMGGESRGLRNMRCRAGQLGARFECITSPGSGTRITVEIPQESARCEGP